MVDSGLIGFDRSAVPNARNEARMPGDHCTRDRAIRQMGWSKRVSQPNCIISFIIFLSLFDRRWLAGAAAPPHYYAVGGPRCCTAASPAWVQYENLKNPAGGNLGPIGTSMAAGTLPVAYMLHSDRFVDIHTVHVPSTGTERVMFVAT